MRLFLTIKHWQLFLLIIGIPLLFEFTIIGLLMSQSQDAAFETMYSILKVIPFVIVIYNILYMGWFWSVGHFLYQIQPPESRLPLGIFRLCVIVPIVLTIWVAVLLYQLFWHIDDANEFWLLEQLQLPVIAPLIAFMVLGIFYVYVFNAKALCSVEQQRDAELGDFVGEFFMFWFLPIGVWFLQPRINKLATSSAELGDGFL